MRIALVSVALTLPLAAQVGTFTTFGTGCPGPITPSLSSSYPGIGSTATVSCSDLPLDTVLSVLFIGNQQVSVPLDLLLGAPGCTAYVGGIFSSPGMSVTAPTATVDLALPNNPAIIGQTLEMQALGLSIGSGWVASDRGTMAVGAPNIFIAGPVTNPGNGKTYAILPPNDWASAEALAQSYGGHLVTVEDSVEAAWIATFTAGAGINGQTWIGLSRTATGPWTWASGAAFSFTNWAPGEPNNATGVEFAVAFYPVANPFGGASQWNDAPGSWPLYSVVEL